MSWWIAMAVSKNTPNRDDRVRDEFLIAAMQPHQSEIARETLKCLGEIAALATSAIGGGVLIESQGHLDVLHGGGHIELRVKAFNVLEAVEAPTAAKRGPVLVGSA